MINGLYPNKDYNTFISSLLGVIDLTFKMIYICGLCTIYHYSPEIYQFNFFLNNNCPIMIHHPVVLIAHR